MSAARLLYRDGAERERLLDMGARLAPAQLLALCVLVIPAVIAVPVYGWRMLVPLAIAALFFAVTSVPPIQRRWGDWAGFTAWVFAQAMVMWSLALVEGPVIYALSLPIVPMVLAATGFRRETVAVGAVVTMVALGAVTLLTSGDEIAATSPALWVPALLILVISLSAMAVRDADMVTRDDAVLDELTGLLNRVALQARVAEITHQVRVTHERVALLVADLDHFKAVNDTLGHAAGDRVLAEVARRLGGAAGEAAVFRFGGEEFVVLLTGADEASARELAERLCASVAAAPIEGRAQTVSVGVAVTAPDEGFEYRRDFVRADAALYAAKATGRNRVCVAGAMPAVAETRAHTSRVSGPERGEARSVRALASRDGTWLARDQVTRAHLVDIVGRTARYNKLTSGLVTLAIVSMVPLVGWTMLIPVVIAGLVVEMGMRAVLTHRRPEYVFVGSFIVMQVGAAAAVLLAGPRILFALPIFAIAMFGSSASLPGRGAGLLVVTGAMTMAASALTVGSVQIADNPVILALPISLTVMFAIVGSAMGARVAELRVTAISDGLTGALNRVALEARIAELSHRPADDEAIAFILADLDHFKQVNDEHGHEEGDRVLAAVADRMRSELRAFDAMYRIGGEEFAILVPGATEAVAAGVAERIRNAVRCRPAAGVDVTVSLGVAASPAGAPFDYDATFGMADAALLAAKREGRDRVVVGGTGAAASAAQDVRVAG